MTHLTSIQSLLTSIKFAVAGRLEANKAEIEKCLAEGMAALRNKDLFFSLILGLFVCFSCEKEKPSPVQVIDHNAVLDGQLADITGIYHGTLSQWIVDGHDVPGDTIWDIQQGYFVLRTGRGENDSWSFIVNFDSLSTEGGYHHHQPDNPSGNPAYFSYQIRVDPVYGLSDGKNGGVTVWRSPPRAKGFFSYDAGPGRTGVFYEGDKR